MSAFATAVYCSLGVAFVAIRSLNRLFDQCLKLFVIDLDHSACGGIVEPLLQLSFQLFACLPLSTEIVYRLVENCLARGKLAAGDRIGDELLALW